MRRENWHLQTFVRTTFIGVVVNKSQLMIDSWSMGTRDGPKNTVSTVTGGRISFHSNKNFDSVSGTFLDGTTRCLSEIRVREVICTFNGRVRKSKIKLRNDSYTSFFYNLSDPLFYSFELYLLVDVSTRPVTTDRISVCVTRIKRDNWPPLSLLCKTIKGTSRLLKEGFSFLLFINILYTLVQTLCVKGELIQ